MAEFYSYEELKNGGTFKVNSTTVSALQGEPTALCGKVVTLTGDYEVGYGNDGDNPLGFVEQVEYEANDHTKLVCSVVWNTSREGITCDTGDTAGDWLACKGDGTLKKSTTATSAKAWSVDSSNYLATVYIHG